MLLFFELGKELEDERMDGGNKNYKLIARRVLYIKVLKRATRGSQLIRIRR